MKDTTLAPASSSTHQLHNTKQIATQPAAAVTTLVSALSSESASGFNQASVVALSTESQSKPRGVRSLHTPLLDATVTSAHSSSTIPDIHSAHQSSAPSALSVDVGDVTDVAILTGQHARKSDNVDARSKSNKRAEAKCIVSESAPFNEASASSIAFVATTQLHNVNEVSHSIALEIIIIIIICISMYVDVISLILWSSRQSGATVETSAPQGKTDSGVSSALHRGSSAAGSLLNVPVSRISASANNFSVPGAAASITSVQHFDSDRPILHDTLVAPSHSAPRHLAAKSSSAHQSLQQHTPPKNQQVQQQQSKVHTPQQPLPTHTDTKSGKKPAAAMSAPPQVSSPLRHGAAERISSPAFHVKDLWALWALPAIAHLFSWVSESVDHVRPWLTSCGAFGTSLHRRAWLTCTADATVLPMFSFFFTFPLLADVSLTFLPPCIVPCTWYAFVAFILSSTHGPPLWTWLVRLLAPLLLLLNTTHHCILLDLNGGERLVIALAACGLRTLDILRPIFLLALGALMLGALQLGQTFAMQWATLVMGTLLLSINRHAIADRNASAEVVNSITP